MKNTFGTIRFFLCLTLSLFVVGSPETYAAGAAVPWQMGFQEAASPVMEQITSLHNFLMIVITIISFFVLFLLLYICTRFSAKNNPKPSTVTHNTKLEVIWTAIPAIILIVIAIPSLKLLYYMDRTEDADMTLKVIGYQWYWGYEYPDNDNVSFESYMIPDEDLKPGQLRLLEVDNRIVLPVDTTVRILVTAADVIHAWAVPALGIKTDAVPGKLNETWVKITKPGVYRGQCSELCGTLHGFMPIVIEAVSKEDFKRWIEKTKVKFSSIEKNNQYALNK